MKKNDRITPEGTKDFLFEECLTRRYIERTIGDVFSSHGFHEVVTPGLEFYDVFDPDFSGISQNVMYKMSDKHGRLVVMRPDSTLPIARLTATRLQNLPKPIRLFYTQPIYRNHPGLTGQSDESVQTGIELLGAGGIRADLDVMSTALEALGKCVPGFRLEIGHAGFFRSLAEKIPAGENLREKIRGAIETKNYARLNRILDTLPASEDARALRELPRLFGGEEVFERASCLQNSAKMTGTLDYLRKIYRSLSALDQSGKLMIDLGLVQRNDYYTGIVFSAYVEEFGDAVLLGGRYDNLLGHFGQPTPAIGFAVNVDAIAKTLLDRGNVSPVLPMDIMVHGDDGYEVQALEYAADLIAKGLHCETSVFKTQDEAIDYAQTSGIKRIDFVGETIKTVNLI
ncbi:MAG: ATP phosphoribosyltransferase regulatory subunit [Oscillospiraceae bacterium]|jgi:ATP phosphoribosyltransferase regulatory subunit|nr:ATP phosphoribosyltransferase regulatory subunit [Oscillospiraceae bacterium]